MQPPRYYFWEHSDLASLAENLEQWRDGMLQSHYYMRADRSKARYVLNIAGLWAVTLSSKSRQRCDDWVDVLRRLGADLDSKRETGGVFRRLLQFVENEIPTEALATAEAGDVTSFTEMLRTDYAQFCEDERRIATDVGRIVPSDYL